MQPGDKQSAFFSVYKRNLYNDVMSEVNAGIPLVERRYVLEANTPERFVESLIARQTVAIIKSEYFNWDTRAFKATCVEVGIEHTRASILQYLGLPLLGCS